MRFELTERQAAQLISSQPPSTTRPLLRTDSNFFIIAVFYNQCQGELCRLSLIRDNCSYAKPSVHPISSQRKCPPYDRSFWIISAWSRSEWHCRKKRSSASRSWFTAEAINPLRRQRGNYAACRRKRPAQHLRLTAAESWPSAYGPLSEADHQAQEEVHGSRRNGPHSR